MAENIFRAGAQGFADTDAMTRSIQRRRADYGAAPKIAAGNFAGAAQDYGQAGLADEARQSMADQQGADTLRQAADTRQQAKDLKDQEHRLDFLKRAGLALRQIPLEQRGHAFEQIAPALKAMGMDDQTLAQVPQHLDDASLDAFVGEVDNHIKLFNTSGGVVAVDQNALGQNMQDPNASRVVYQDPTAAEYRQAMIEATRARAGASSASAEAARARAARTRRMPLGGGSGGAASSSLPPGYVPR